MELSSTFQHELRFIPRLTELQLIYETFKRKYSATFFKSLDLWSYYWWNNSLVLKIEHANDAHAYYIEWLVGCVLMSHLKLFCPFIRPSSDGKYYGMVMSVRPSVRPTLRPGLRPPVFRTFFIHVCVDILSWNFAHDFDLMYYRSSSRVVTLRQFLKELCLFVNLEYR